MVELPPGTTNATISVAAAICNKLVADGLLADVQQHFPTLTQKQLSGVYLTPGSGVFNGHPAVYVVTGLRYQGSIQQAKAVADYCKQRAEESIAVRSADSKGKEKGVSQ